MRFGLSLAALAVSSLGLAQLPDVAVFTDLRPTLSLRDKEDIVVRWLDPEGRPSIVGIRFALENGARIKVTQRMQRVPGDPDQLDEAWISLNDEWLLGKQYVPFGVKSLYRESVPGISFNTQLVFDGIPAEAAVFDSGVARPRGFSARIGRPQLGISLAAGDHLAVQGTSLLPFRSPGQAELKGGGWRLAYGLDSTINFASFKLEAEHLVLKDAQAPTSGDRSYSQVKAFIPLPLLPYSLEAIYSHDWTNKDGVLGAAATIPVDMKTSMRPLIRFDKHGFREAALTLRIKL